MTTKAINILGITTLFPNDQHPRHGIFVQNRYLALQKRSDVHINVIAPVAKAPLLNLIPGSRFQANNKVPDKACLEGIKVRHPRYLTIPGTNLIDVVNSITKSALNLAPELYPDGFDLVDGQYLYPDGIAAARLAKHYDKPLVLTARGSDVNYWLADTSKQQMIIDSLHQAAKIICMSQALKDKIIAYGISADKIEVIMNGINHDTFNSSAHGPNNSGYLLSVGNLVPLKGHDLVLRAMTDMPDEKLTIIGQGQEEKKITHMIRDLNLDDRVQLLPNLSQSELAGYYANAKATVLMSAMEGMPNVLMESLSCGTPVIATNVGGISEIVHPGNGILLPERSPEELSKAIRSFNQTDWDKETIEKDMKMFNWSEVAQRQVDLYQQILHKN